MDFESTSSGIENSLVKSLFSSARPSPIEVWPLTVSCFSNIPKISIYLKSSPIIKEIIYHSLRWLHPRI